MNRRTTRLALLVLAGLGTRATAQVPPPPPARGPSPLTYVRFSGPGRAQVTFYQGQPAGRTFDAPAVVAMRPGYLYRVKLSNLEGYPGLNLFPTVEVCGSLSHGPK